MKYGFQFYFLKFNYKLIILIFLIKSVKMDLKCDIPNMVIF